MEAFVLAAGLGTRLRPLTNSRPKALVEVDGKSLLEINLEKIIAAGASRIVVNVHHFGEQIIEFLHSRTWDCEVVVSDERGMLLDTGGGLKKAQRLFSGKEPVLIHNVDILSRIPLTEMADQHIADNCLATMAVSERDTSRYLLFGHDKRLIGWHKKGTEEYLWADKPMEDYKPMAFSGIAVVSPEFFDMLPDAERPYTIIPCYVHAAKDHVIKGFEHNAEDWMDVGKPETLAQAHKILK
ncbi:MAG: nucleotidyltransferase family protein [Bacteroidales bacterium]|nr:nucleotidyltransferase family protein [Bacteroidales bacterium]